MNNEQFNMLQLSERETVLQACPYCGVHTILHTSRFSESMSLVEGRCPKYGALRRVLSSSTGLSPAGISG